MKLTSSKKIFLLLLLAFPFAGLNAQIQFGLKAGFNIANVTGGGLPDAKTLLGFQGGGLVKIPLTDMLSLQPEAVYSIQGFKYPDSTSGISVNFKNSYINIPVLLTYTLPAGLFFQAGPQVGFLVSASAGAGGVSISTKSIFKSTDFSLAFGAGYNMTDNFGINARYHLGLTNIAVNPGEGESVKNSVIQVGFFYLFGEHEK